MQPTEQFLPLGSSTFETLRAKNQIYVDKTELLFRLALEGGKYFLSRPRRFGKSLLVSTFRSLFADGLRDFKGLRIESLWTDTTYPVLQLDFSLVKEFDDVATFLQLFDEVIDDAAERAGLDIPRSPEGPIRRIRSFLSRQPANSLVLLIDEYDAPLTSHLEDRKRFEEIRETLSLFYSAVKSHEGCLRFFFMTGITKLSGTRIFSGFNNLTDLSLTTEYAALVGYTEDEIERCLAPYLAHAERILKKSHSELMTEMRSRYDGFSFDRRALTHVYCPWSVLKFLAFPDEGFQDYWYDSAGQPTVLMNYLKNHSLNDPQDYSTARSIPIKRLEASKSYDELDAEVLLIQAGYLTFDTVDSDGWANLKFPNREVRMSMAQLYAEKILQGRRFRMPGGRAVGEILKNGTAREVVELFDWTANALDHRDYPIHDEASCRALFQVLLIGGALIPHVEVHSAQGRSDLEVTTEPRHWVFEFKYARKSSDIERLLEEGLAQVRSRRYGEAPHGCELHRLVLVFDAEKRNFAAWSAV